MSILEFIVIGITDSADPFFSPDVLSIIRQGKVFSGGRRHHEIVAPLLPADARWIDITVPLDDVFQQYRSIANAEESSDYSSQAARATDTVVVFASGDPLFFGFANTIRKRMPQAGLTVYPSFNSLQMLTHRLTMPYHDMRIVSLTGRPWSDFDRALIERAAKIGVLTDREHTPSSIARRMLDYGYADYVMHVGEHLGNHETERVSTLSLQETACQQFTSPNCIILESPDGQTTQGRVRSYGIPDSTFTLLDGREKMITKMPIRLLALQALELPRRHTLWDIGFCTGSVSIEARLLFPHLHIEAFEIRPECESIISENAKRHGAPGIGVHIGDFLTADCDSLAAANVPDAVFIGGHGGRLADIMAKVLRYLAPGGCIVMNSVTAPKVLTNSEQLFTDACQQLGLRQNLPLSLQLNDYHPIKILKAVNTDEPSSINL